MKLHHKDALETYKIFPYIAWVLVILFAFFVYNITRELHVVTTDLQAQTKELRQKAHTPVDQITDFEPKRNNR